MFIFFLFYLFLRICVVFAQEGWAGEQVQVLERAQRENKMILLACIGEDFCPWSQKMIQEILDQKIFTQRMQEHAVLWRVSLHAEASRGEEKWRKSWHIEHLPTLLLLDPQGREFARFGYLPLEPQECALQLLHVFFDFKMLCRELEEQKKADWLALYQKAKPLSSYAFKKTILERAEKQNPSVDVLLEKYFLLIEKKGLKHSLVKKCRKEIFCRDPTDCFKSRFKIALAEFRLLEERAERNIEKVIRPLKRFAQHFGSKDPENLWKAEKAITFYLLAKRKMLEARTWAARAVQHAPQEEKADIIHALSE